jgi:type IV pilus assembly protein PilB
MMVSYTPTLVDILKKTKAVPEADLKRAQELHQKSGKKLIHVLVDEGIIPEKDLVSMLSLGLKIPILDLASFKVDTNVLSVIPKKIAERYEVLPLAQIGSILTLATADPLDVTALDDIKKITRKTVRPVLVSHKDLIAAIENYYAEQIKFEELLGGDLDPDSVEVLEEETVTAPDQQTAADAPIIQMVDLILQEAIASRASDIHFEPYTHHLRIRYRIDGALRPAPSPPHNLYGALLTRIKIVSNLDITEKRLPQDGRFKTKFEGREIDFRVSVLPTYHGEKAVLRILDKTTIKSGLGTLGFSPKSIQRFQEAMSRPYGMILVTGPTGSGKSTTLYSVLNELNTKERNIMTIEDPVEYQIHGISQTQVNPDIGLTFANGLRSLLRQNPDIMLVGEIRDGETADIAVKAALTGHLVFSTLHTNNAAGAVTRLEDMGVEPFLISSSLIVATAQRLMRRICAQCKERAIISKTILESLPKGLKWIREAEAYRGKGCANCRNTGYRGRLAVMEVLPIDDEIQKMIIERKSSTDIDKAARQKGMKTLFEEAIEAFRKGYTTLEEVLRVTSYEE